MELIVICMLAALAIVQAAKMHHQRKCLDDLEEKLDRLMSAVEMVYDGDAEIRRVDDTRIGIFPL